MGFKSTIIKVDLEQPNKIRGDRVPNLDDDSWVDPDFGYMTKERRESLLESWDYLKSLMKREDKDLGIIAVFGTSTGEDNSMKDFQEMLYNPDSYKIVDFNKEEDQ